jgi:hypothetical protein
MKHYFYTLNIFPSIPPSIDEHELRNQIISTRLFIFFLILSLGILLLYTSLINVTQTVNVKTPTISQYSKLYSTYSQTLSCPCNKISINYDTFIQIKYTLHQVCNSVFVTKYWTDYLLTSSENTPLSVNDFRWTGSFTFQGLSALCGLVNETIFNRLIEFYSNEYITASVIPLQIFQSQTQQFISQFISTMTNDFLLSLSIIRDTTQSNALLSGGLTNYVLDTPRGDTYTNAYSQRYDNCSCGYSGTCAYQSRIYDYSENTILYYVPGIYIGCYMIESLFQSNLQCFYNQTCINELQSYLYSSLSVNVTALDKSLSSHFFENSTIEELLDQLMVEEWNSSKIYDSYYNECQPSQCIYTHVTKNSVIYIVTTLLGLIGGLITVLKLIVPRLVMLVRKKKVLRRPKNGKTISKNVLCMCFNPIASRANISTMGPTEFSSFVFFCFYDYVSFTFFNLLCIERNALYLLVYLNWQQLSGFIFLEFIEKSLYILR